MLNASESVSSSFFFGIASLTILVTMCLSAFFCVTCRIVAHTAALLKRLETAFGGEDVKFSR